MAGSILGFLSSLKAFRARASAASTNLFFEGDNADLSCDRAGNLWVRNADAPAGTAVSPGVDIAAQQLAFGWQYDTGPVYDSSNAIRVVPSVLTQVGGFNPTAAQLYVLIFNTIAVPAAGAIPVMSFQVPANGNFAWEPSRDGRSFTTGISFAVSITGDFYTVLATGVWLFAEGWTV